MKHISDINIVAYLTLLNVKYDYIYKKDAEGKFSFVYSDSRVGDMIKEYKSSGYKDFAANLNGLRKVIHSLK